jgi:hypothetical protein
MLVSFGWAGGLIPILIMGLWVALRAAQRFHVYRSLPEAFVLFALSSFVITESATAFRLLGFWWAFFAWTILFTVLATLLFRQRRLGFANPKIDFSNEPLQVWIAFAIAFICLCTLVIALGAEPTNNDGMTYRLPRIEVWIQNSSTEHFFTNDERQIGYPPLAEYMLLQTRLLSGGDSFYMIVQWLAMASSLASVYHITLMLLGSKRLAWFAALFAATLPIGIVESTSVQNDYITAALLLGFVQGIVGIAKEDPESQRIAWCVFSGTLAGATKPTAFLFGWGFAVWLGVLLMRRLSVRKLAASVTLAGMVLGLTLGTFAVRNLHTFGSILPPTASVTTPGAIGIAVVADNVILGIGSNFFMGEKRFDTDIIQRGFLQITSALGTDRQREASMTQGTKFSPLAFPWYVFHEDFAPNPLHTLFILLFAGFAIPATKETKRQDLIIYAMCCVVAVIAFSAGVRWQPWITRLQLPLFLLFAPLVAAGLGIFTRPWVIAVFATILTVAALGPLLFNPSRAVLPGWYPPFYLQDRASLFFEGTPVLASPYMTTLQWLNHEHVRNIGTLSRGSHPDYPLWKYLSQERSSPLRIEPVKIGKHQPNRLLGPFRPEAVVGFDPSLPDKLIIEGQPMHRAITFGNRITIYTPG